jgi:hypothetical protein
VYATQTAKRRIVAVPYNYGVTKLASVNDLFVHAWVPNTSRSSNVVDMNIGHLLVTALPGSSVPLEFSYSLFYVPRGRGFPVIRNACGSIRGEHDWQGNILVVKRGKRKPAINMEREDAFLVDSIVSAYVVALWCHAISVNSFCVDALITASWFKAFVIKGNVSQSEVRSLEGGY